VLIGLACFVLLVGAVAYAVKAGLGGFAGGYELTSSFDRVIAGLEPGSAVKIRGVTVGEVKSIDLDNQSGKVIIALRMQSDRQVPDTAVASVEPLSIFGPKFIKLVPGEHEQSGPFLPEGGRIAQTVKPVEFLDTLAQTYRLVRATNPEDLGTVIHTLAEGLGGLGPTVGQTIDDAAVATGFGVRTLEPFLGLLRDLRPLSDRVVADAGDFSRISSDLHQVLPDIASRADKLARLLDQTAKVSSEAGDLLSRHRMGINNLLTGVGAILAAIHAQLGDLPGFLESLGGFGELGRAIFVPGPAGTTLLGARGVIPADLCRLVTGALCPPSSRPEPAP
jgi:virulence factor Mce-like protein